MHLKYFRHYFASRSLACIALFFGLLVSVAHAHPLSQGALDVTVQPDRLVVQARVTLEEVSVTNMLVAPPPGQPPVAGDSDAAFSQHADYLAKHLHFTADGAALIGKVTKVVPPGQRSDVKNSSAVYTIEYPFPVASPKVIGLRQDSLTDAQFTTGQNWVAIYFVTMSQPGRPPVQALLSRDEPMTFNCQWGDVPSSAGENPSSSMWHLFFTYCVHGIDHILGEPTGRGVFSRSDVGFDHLLFVTALVLSTKSMWDLLKVVSAFTLAHTITLTLAALQWVNVSERISEPLIALSIVFVAVQNVFWPEQSRGKMRLAAAFFFGLFHGLGFAGALLETMQALHGSVILVAILAFSIGVELGHQIVVVPLFFGLKFLRQSRPTALSQERMHFNIQRFGSMFITVAGTFYLFVALRLSFR